MQMIWHVSWTSQEQRRSQESCRKRVYSGCKCHLIVENRRVLNHMRNFQAAEKTWQSSWGCTCTRCGAPPAYVTVEELILFKQLTSAAGASKLWGRYTEAGPWPPKFVWGATNHLGPKIGPYIWIAVTVKPKLMPFQSADSLFSL